jgi:hypothetical protein
MKFSKEKQLTFGDVNLNAPSSMLSVKKEQEPDEAEKIMQNYGRLTGQLYSSNLTNRKNNDVYGSKNQMQYQLNTDSSVGMMVSS